MTIFGRQQRLPRRTARERRNAARMGLAGQIGDGLTVNALGQIDLYINGLTEASIAAGDFVPFWDITATAANKKITFANFEATLNHDNLAGFVADEHIDWTGTTENLSTSGSGTFGQIIDNGLTASLGVYTDASKQLTSTPPTSGVLGYWSRAGTVLSPATAGDDITVTGDISTSASILTTGGGVTGRFQTGLAGNTVLAYSGGNLDIRAGAGNLQSQNVLRVDSSGDFDFLAGNLTTTGEVHILADNAKYFFGAGNDVSIYFDGEDLIINSENITVDDELLFKNFNTYRFDTHIITTGGITGNVLTATSNIILNGTLTDISNTVDLNDNDLVTTGLGTFGNLDVDTLNFNANVITDSTGTIDFNDENLVTTGRVGIGAAAAYPLDITLGAADVRGVYVDGSTTAFTTSGTNVYTAYLRRDINWGTGVVGNVYGIYNKIVHESTDATLPASKTFRSIFSEYQNTGAFSNDSASNRTVQGWAFDMSVNDDGDYDSSSTGYIRAIGLAGRFVTVIDNIFTDSGGQTPNNQSSAYGLWTTVINRPTLTSGTLLVKNYGLIINVTGTTVGTSTNYGIFINTSTGADNNYGIWDASGADWVLDGDNQKILWGEGQDVSTYFDGEDWIFNSENITANDEIHFTNFNAYTFDNDFYWVGSGSGLPYGHMYVDGTQAIRIALTLNTPTEIKDDGTTSADDGWLSGDLNLFSFPTGGTEHFITVTKAGVYHVNWNVSFTMVTGAANTQIHAGLAVDGTPVRDKCEAHRTISNNTDTENMAGSCTIDLPNGTEELSLWMENTTNSNDADVVHGSLVAVMVGGT